MLLTISTTHQPATDLGYLLHKHPDRLQSFNLSFGQARVFYPVATENECRACLLLDVDPVDMVRGKNRLQGFLRGHYVNDRPYVASSFLSVAISQVFGSALNGRCKDRAELAKTPIPLTARIDVLPVRGGEEFLRRIFEPLGYEVTATQQTLDEKFPEWGDSPYFSVEIRGTKTLCELLTHLYVLIPVFDNNKHYFVGEAEVDKLLAKGSRVFQIDADGTDYEEDTEAATDLSADDNLSGWLAQHPEKEIISRRFLKHRVGLLRQALDRLTEDDNPESDDDEQAIERQEAALERAVSLNEQRHGAVLAVLRASGAQSVVDLGCGEGKLLREIFKEKQFTRVLGMDVSLRALEMAENRLKIERLSERQAERISLIHGSLMYRDRRLEGFDAAAVVEVIEHLDPPRLAALERALFEFARPQTIVLTTPNREYNVMWDTLPAGQFRHADHRFEWTRAEFQSWAQAVATKFGYTVRFLPVGPEDKTVGPPTQMGVFECHDHSGKLNG